jgi:hypothetical protein
MIPLIPIRCPRSQCRSKIGEGLEGTYICRCRGCGWIVTVERREGRTVELKAEWPLMVDNQPQAVIYG